MSRYSAPGNACDRGPTPLVTNIARGTECNNNYRSALWTGQHLQVTLMCIPAGGDIGLEVHPDTDQFLRIECGTGLVMMGPRRNVFHCRQGVQSGCAVLVPAGTWHNIVNTGCCPLKLYTIYAPPHHLHGTIHTTKAQAEAQEH